MQVILEQTVCRKTVAWASQSMQGPPVALTLKTSLVSLVIPEGYSPWSSCVKEAVEAQAIPATLHLQSFS